MIAEARVHSIKRLPEEQRKEHGALVLVTRKWIQGVSRKDVDYWLQSAAPSQSLLDSYRAGLISWGEFEQQYKDEQLNLAQCRVVRYQDNAKLYDEVVERSPLYVLQALQGLHGGKVTLLCWENSQFCHRFALQSLLARQFGAESEI